MNARDVGGRLYDLRIAHKETQEQVAEAVGISHVALGRYENGLRLPRLDILNRIAAHFGVSVDEITGGNADESEIDSELADLNLALSGAIHMLDKEEKQDVLNYVRFKQSQKRK